MKYIKNSFPNICKKTLENHYYKKDSVEADMEKISDYKRELNSIL